MDEPDEVPPELRESLRERLDALVRGEHPEMLMWVHEYGDDGATLVRQPEDIWTHVYVVGGDGRGRLARHPPALDDRRVTQ